MSFDNHYPNRKDRRRPYYNSGAVDRTCRPNGSCTYCENNRRYAVRKAERAADEQLEAFEKGHAMTEIEIVLPDGFGRMSNRYHSIDDLPLDRAGKIAVLEWLARKLWVVQARTTDGDMYGKSYDPMLIDDEEKVVYSYVFGLADGGRVHPLPDELGDLERMMVDETVAFIQERAEW